jgi:hypothetical protein
MKESRMADDYESLAEKTELTYEEAIALKEEIQKRGDQVQFAADVVLPPKKWNLTIALSPNEAAAFLNTTPAQGPGEAMVNYRPSGQLDVYWYG